MIFTIDVKHLRFTSLLDALTILLHDYVNKLVNNFFLTGSFKQTVRKNQFAAKSSHHYYFWCFNGTPTKKKSEFTPPTGLECESLDGINESNSKDSNFTMQLLKFQVVFIKTNPINIKLLHFFLLSSVKDRSIVIQA